MMRERASGLAQSVYDRLKAMARATDRPFAEVLELYAVERFLHRLGTSPHRDVFVLKGATLLRSWLGADSRPTRDVDLLGSPDLDEPAFRQILLDILREDVEVDGIDFEDASIAIRPIREKSAPLGLRAKFDGYLGRTHLRYQVDVGFGDHVFPPPVEFAPDAFLDLPIASLRAYTPYTTVAEKLEAMVVLGRANSRTKDYYDLLQLPRTLAFDGATLAEAIRRTFARRERRIPPEPVEGLADDFASEPLQATRWRTFLRKNRLEVTVTDFLEVVARIRRFAQPALDAARDGGAFDRRWPAGGPWQPDPDGGGRDGG